MSLNRLTEENQSLKSRGSNDNGNGDGNGNGNYIQVENGEEINGEGNYGDGVNGEVNGKGTSSEEQSDNDEQQIDDDDEDDDYLMSDEDEYEITNNSERHHRMGYNATLADHSQYLTNTISHALSSLQLDKSLALQAQLSGVINNENQRITEKHQQLLEKLENINNLYNKNFGLIYDPKTHTKTNRLKQMRHDIEMIEKRIQNLKQGNSNKSSLTSFFTTSNKNSGVINKYPVEYNQAKDKILERQIDDDIS